MVYSSVGGISVCTPKYNILESVGPMFTPLMPLDCEVGDIFVMKFRAYDLLCRNKTTSFFKCFRSQISIDGECYEIQIVKSEDVDIPEELIEENRVYDRAEFLFKVEDNPDGPDEIHKEIVNSPKHKCDYCRSSFKSKYYLQTHINTVHLNLRQFKCNLCDFATNYRKILKKHINSNHFNSKYHKCRLCDFAADHEVDLKKHMLSTHPDSKRFECHLCDFATNTKGTLKVHISSIHFNLKQHKCQFCDFASNYRSDLRKHIDSVHFNLKQHKCSLCDFATSH